MILRKLSISVLCRDNIILVFLWGNFVLFGLAGLAVPSEGRVMNVYFNNKDDNNMIHTGKGWKLQRVGLGWMPGTWQAILSLPFPV